MRLNWETDEHIMPELKIHNACKKKSVIGLADIENI